jgi:hypothetical protein
MATRYNFTDNSGNNFTPMLVTPDGSGKYYVVYLDPAENNVVTQTMVPISTGNYTLQVVSANLGDTIIYYDTGPTQRAAVVAKVIDSTHVDLVYCTDDILGLWTKVANAPKGTSVGDWNFTV